MSDAIPVTLGSHHRRPVLVHDLTSEIHGLAGDGQELA